MSWSYELLGEAERRLLARLSVLRGGFDLDVAERVAGGEPLAPQAVAGLLASLAGKSLVQVQDGAVIRYSLLETVRQFAAGRLAASGEETAVHAAPAGVGAGGGPVGGGGPAGRRVGGLVRSAFRRTGQHPRRVVVGAGRRRAGGGTGTGRPAGPVVDRHRPVQRSGPVPDHGGRRPGRGGSRHPGPGNARRGLVGVPPGGQSAGGPARRRRHSLCPAGRRTAAGSLGPQPAGRPGLVRGRRGPDRRRDRSQPGSLRPGRSGARGAGPGPAGPRGLPGRRPGRAGPSRPARGRARPDGGGPGRARPRADLLVDVRDRRSGHPARHRGRAR